MARCADHSLNRTGVAQRHASRPALHADRVTIGALQSNREFEDLELLLTSNRDVVTVEAWGSTISPRGAS